MPVGTRLPESLVRELSEATGELGQTRSELVRRGVRVLPGLLIVDLDRMRPSG
ncbi:ribbon-helix-helix protein, CopG family [Actinomyces sp. HMSC035G02]|uniref:ribbon-helix-helix protein, CopG family n=1 Tax=Actinomyces sp. HMSC035G02 TaxID=1739406 RepID=UPI00256FF318|nr:MULTISPECIES: ribbon-helix-helix protein, CopG family [Actinomycetaceae]